MDNIEVRVALLERLQQEQEGKVALQLGRIISDIESEKGTRLRLHEDWRRDTQALSSRVLMLEKHMAIGVGIIAAVQVLVPLVFRVLR